MLRETQFKFTNRERQVAEFIVNELLSNKEIGDVMGVTEQVVKNRVRCIYNRVGLHQSGDRKRIVLWRMLRVPPEKVQTRAPRFSDREWQIATLLSEGLANAEIASLVGSSAQMVKNYVRDIFDKTGVWTRLELAAWVDSHHRPDPSVVS